MTDVFKLFLFHDFDRLVAAERLNLELNAAFDEKPCEGDADAREGYALDDAERLGYGIRPIPSAREGDNRIEEIGHHVAGEGGSSGRGEEREPRSLAQGHQPIEKQIEEQVDGQGVEDPWESADELRCDEELMRGNSQKEA